MLISDQTTMIIDLTMLISNQVMLIIDQTIFWLLVVTKYERLHPCMLLWPKTTIGSQAGF